MFDPKCDKYPYPEDTDAHYLVIKKDNGLVFDADYPYIDKSKSFRFKQFWVRVLLRLIVFPMSRIKLGLKIEGRENLKKNKALLDQGAISVSNHIHLWDYISIMKAIRPRKSNVLVWAANVRGENSALVRLVGGIPIPENDFKATKAYMHTLKDLLDDGGWLQIYAEGSMWEYYTPIRPFKRGAAYFACAYDKPIVPMAFSYRKPSKLREKLFKQPACITLKVGEPLFADPSLKGKEQEIELTIRCHEAVCRLAGIDPAENIYPPIFDHNKRVHYE